MLLPIAAIASTAQGAHAQNSRPQEQNKKPSMLPILQGENPDGWRESIYYHYYEYLAEHAVDTSLRSS